MKALQYQLLLFALASGLPLPSAHADLLTDALDMPGLTWTSFNNGGGGPWTVDLITTHDGVDAVRSGTPPYGKHAWLETALTGPGTVTFWAKGNTPGGSWVQSLFLGLAYRFTGDWLANSDARIKQEVETVSDALATLNQVRLVSFRYTDDYLTKNVTVENRRYLNVIAQEFAEVFPGHVKPSGEKLPDGSDILQVDTHPLTIYSAAAIQELNRKLERKDARITELEHRLETLERRLNHKLARGEQ